eukprot:CAMPEP_0171134266 /NCGR_PEP_ID=MMETSP0766_2-20121228/127717_1 /TAXON_ID=439317 /ORGANISM="Gambierdiscus australes, Strain CAWD 149" /LENGTH=81 /DNA_ID=CAMNT_0011597697 /DNA_START=275 /DNA_END=517 /DNA_ORIENTATION=+
MANVGHVKADLMRPPRDEPQVDKRVRLLAVRVLADTLIDGDGLTAAGVYAADSLQGIRGVVNGGAHLAAGVRSKRPMHEGN